MIQKILLGIERLLGETGHNLFAFDKSIPEFNKSDYQELESNCLVRKLLDRHLDESVEEKRLFV